MPMVCLTLVRKETCTFQSGRSNWKNSYTELMPIPFCTRNVSQEKMGPLAKMSPIPPEIEMFDEYSQPVRPLKNVTISPPS